jgi:Patatin-like phospholipase
MAELTVREVLEQEAEAIHGLRVSGTDDLYVKLNEADRTALCLSGGGIRSAAFALGIIQALAIHPRSATGAPVPAAERSLLAGFHYLSTVSGGGYIGAWLSAGLKRAGFATVWAELTGRPAGPDTEPAALSWLRENSNYLTGKFNFFSADVWAGVAIYLSNILLNWLVILPVICVFLLGLKLFAVLVAWFWRFDHTACPLFGGIALATALMLIISLRFRTRNRPSRNTARADQATFLNQDLLWAILAATGFAVCVVSVCAEVELRGSPRLVRGVLKWLGADPTSATASPALALAVVGASGGAIIYALSWLTAWPRTRGARDFALWTVSGLVFGALVGVGVHLLLNIDDVEVKALFLDSLSAPSERVLLVIIFGVPWILVAQLIAQVIFIGLTTYQDGSDGDREWFGRTAGWLLVTAITWLVLMYLVLAVGSRIVGAIYEVAGTLGPIIGGLSGLLTLALGKSYLLPAIDEAGKLKAWIDMILGIAALIFICILVFVVSAMLDKILLGTSLLQSNLMSSNQFCIDPADTHARVFVRRLCIDINDQRKAELVFILTGMVIIILIGWIASISVNINRFSLYSLYRNRLIRTFLGATNQRRDADPFTGFDFVDNLRMHELWPLKDPEMGWPSSKADWRPFHIVNMTLNIISSKKPVWEQRAEPFTVSPLHSGSSCKAYRPSLSYGDSLGLSLGTAMAISGAPASPSMGYRSSSGAVSFLMGLFNVRLGCWLGNPGQEGETTYFRDGPRTAVVPIFQEMFGLTTDDSKYVYLSDGGHFENLGLYEMVRRRCRFIVVSDACCDPAFALEDLGNAVRNIELDLGISIHFYGLEALKQRPKGRREVGPDHPYHAIGKIDYPNSDGGGATGTILYVKAGYHGTENVGIRTYALTHPAFPHETTTDQWSSESFESYRRLGFEIMDGILSNAVRGLAPGATLTLDKLREYAASYD